MEPLVVLVFCKVTLPLFVARVEPAASVNLAPLVETVIEPLDVVRELRVTEPVDARLNDCT